MVPIHGDFLQWTRLRQPDILAMVERVAKKISKANAK